MDSSTDYCILHPEHVTDLVEDLLASDIISKADLSKLKNDNIGLNLDPALLMDLRHTKRKNIQAANKCEKENNSRRWHEKLFVSSMNVSVKDLKTIDKEIAKTKKELKMLNHHLSKKEDFISNSILAIEEEGKQIFTNSETVQIDEIEVHRNFEMHLDSLEKYVIDCNNHPDAKEQMWKPLHIEYPLGINDATFTEFAVCDRQELEFDIEELSILKQLEINSISGMGKPVEQVSIRDKIKKDLGHTITDTPQNSPEIIKRDSTNCIIGNDVCIANMKLRIARASIQQWKKHVRQRKIIRFHDAMKNKVMNNLLKKILKTWSSHTKEVRSTNTRIKRLQYKASLEEITQTESGKCTLDKIEVIDEWKTQQLKESETKENSLKNGQGNIIENYFHTKQMDVHSKIINDTDKCMVANDKTTSVNVIYEKLGSNDAENKKQFPNDSHKQNIHCKIVTPEFVGVSSEIEKPKIQWGKSKIKKNKVKELNQQTRSLTKNSEQFHFRYIAQEKIIAHQLAVIERQKQIIFDLQAENVVTQSALQKLTAETELKIENSKKLNHLTNNNHTNSEAEKKTSHLKRQSGADKSQELASRMLSRHEYCKKLAEETKNRKKRIEDEKAQVKAELEEKEKEDKQEKNKKRIKQIRLEKILAEKNSKLHLEKIHKINILTETAKSHYNITILRKMFQKLKINRMETLIKANDCRLMFNMRVLKHTFGLLKTNAHKAQSIKHKAAEKFYKDKLIDRHWYYWRQLHQEYKIKVQVSVDMFEVSLQRRMFHKWQDYLSQQKLQNCYKNELADRLYSRKLLIHCLKRWHEFPRLMMAEREHELRLSAWRRTVQEVIPDFKPV